MVDVDARIDHAHFDGLAAREHGPSLGRLDLVHRGGDQAVVVGRQAGLDCLDLIVGLGLVASRTQLFHLLLEALVIFDLHAAPALRANLLVVFEVITVGVALDHDVALLGLWHLRIGTWAVGKCERWAGVSQGQV
eukprot:362935-Chlamydomonas_euryale.AAC.2